MSENIVEYVLLVDKDLTHEIPCHLSEIKKGDLYHLVSGSSRSELLRATADAFESNVNNIFCWSVPNEVVV